MVLYCGLVLVSTYTTKWCMKKFSSNFISELLSSHADVLLILRVSKVFVGNDVGLLRDGNGSVDIISSDHTDINSRLVASSD